MASKISKELTPEQVVELIATLAKTPGGKMLRVIQAEAKKRGVEISIMGATSFRDEELQPYLETLKRAKAKSELLATALIDGDESGLLASNRMLLAEKVSDFLLTEETSPKQFSSLALTLQMLSSANQGDKKTNAALELAQAKLREFEAKEQARKDAAAKLERRANAIKRKGGLSDEAIQLLEESINLMA